VQQHTVYVWGKPHAVITHQRSKSVWLAYGNHLGKPITVKDRSEGAVLKRWRETARYKSN
jgi:hypothetical protein